MTRNPEETRRRLLEAAAAEFATYGIAGARVDRIAGTAGCNKQSIYGHFGSKERLFETVYDAMVVQTVAAVAMDGTNLPEYAGRLFDWYKAHPEVARLATWWQLEKGSHQLTETTTRSGIEKIRKIREAQAAGAVTRAITAEHLYLLILRLAKVQLDQARLDKRSRTSLRSALVESVRRLVAP